MPAGAYRRGHPVYALREVWRALRVPDEMTDAHELRMPPTLRYAWLKGTKIKLELEREARRLLTAEDVETETRRRSALVAATLDQVPRVLARDCGLTPEQVAVVERHLDKLRTAIGLN